MARVGRSVASFGGQQESPVDLYDAQVSLRNHQQQFLFVLVSSETGNEAR